MLRCSFCATAWELRRTRASTAARAASRSSRRRRTKSERIAASKLCSACGGYLKTVDLPELSPFPLLAIADLETMDLDIAAMEHGYSGRRSRTSPPALNAPVGSHADRLEVLAGLLLDVLVQAVAVRVHRDDRRENL